MSARHFLYKDDICSAYKLHWHKKCLTRVFLPNGKKVGAYVCQKSGKHFEIVFNILR